MLEAARAHGLEAPRQARPAKYEGRRTQDWYKIRSRPARNCHRRFHARRTRLFQLIRCGLYDHGKLVHARASGNRLPREITEDILELEAFIVKKSPFICRTTVKALRDVKWIKPELVARSKFLDIHTRTDYARTRFYRLSFRQESQGLRP